MTLPGRESPDCEAVPAAEVAALPFGPRRASVACAICPSYAGIGVKSSIAIRIRASAGPGPSRSRRRRWSPGEGRLAQGRAGSVPLRPAPARRPGRCASGRSLSDGGLRRGRTDALPGHVEVKYDPCRWRGELVSCGAPPAAAGRRSAEVAAVLALHGDGGDEVGRGLSRRGLAEQVAAVRGELPSRRSVPARLAEPGKVARPSRAVSDSGGGDLEREGALDRLVDVGQGNGSPIAATLGLATASSDGSATTTGELAIEPSVVRSGSSAGDVRTGFSSVERVPTRPGAVRRRGSSRRDPVVRGLVIARCVRRDVDGVTGQRTNLARSSCSYR